MVKREIIVKIFDDIIGYSTIIDEKCKYETFEYTNSKGEKIILKVREVAKPSTFLKHLKEAYKTQDPKNAWRVEVPSDDEADENYQNTKLYVTRHGSTIAVRSNGDIISVCGNNSGVKENSGALLSYAVSKGGDRLDSFDGNYGFYRYCGFEPVSYVDFVEEFAPPSWVKGRDNPEPIIFFKYTGEKSEFLSPQEFYDKVPITADYDEAHLLRDNDIEYNSKRFKNKNEVITFVKSKKYPVSFEEFEKRVIELLLETYGDSKSETEKLLDLVERLQAEDDNDYIKSLYSDSCYRYDRFGGTAFNDQDLINQPVRLIYLLYED